MDIKLLIKALTPNELFELGQYLKKTPKPTKLTIKELIKLNPQISVRLFTSLDIYSKTYTYVDEINKQRFLTIRNTGERSWNELSELLVNTTTT